MINKSALLVIAREGFNEIEYLTVKRTLEKRGILVFIASDAVTLCAGSQGLRVKNDVRLYNINPNSFGAIVFIGGRGFKKYWTHEPLHRTARKFAEAGKITSAICVAPVLLGNAGLLAGRAATCYPDVRADLEKSGTVYKTTPVVKDKHIITANGPQAAPEFAELIAAELLKKRM